MKKSNFFKRTGINAIEFYQKRISFLFGNNCRFYPTCSEYTKQAIDKYGLFLGTIKGIMRILRCNPLFKGGVDHLK